MKKIHSLFQIYSIVFMIAVILSALLPPIAQAAGGMVWDVEQQTTSAFDKFDPMIQVVGNNIYYVWNEQDASGYWQIWTASMNTDGSGWEATKRTTSPFDKYGVQFEVVGSVIYYVWPELDGNALTQIWTAEMNTDGTGWTATQRTNELSRSRFEPRMQVDGSKIHYIGWSGGGGIWRGEMNTDGTGWSLVTLTTEVDGSPDMEIVGSTIYYIWSRADSIPTSYSNLVYASIDTDGTNYSETQLTNFSNDEFFFEMQLEVHNSTIYYIWTKRVSGSNNTLWTSQTSLDGSNWKTTERIGVPSNQYFYPQIGAFGNQIYYSWVQYNTDTTHYDSYTATYDIDDYEWRPMQRIVDGQDDVWSSKFYIDDPYVYRIAESMDVSSKWQLWTIKESNTDTAQETQTVTATVPSSLTFTIDGVTAGNPCANSGSNADITTTGTTIPFGIYTGSQSKIGCQTLTVSTNATDGYVITVEQDQDLTSSGADIINPFSGTYATPTTWASPPGTGTDAYFGYTTDDTDLPSFQTSKYGNFLANDTPYQIVYESGPVSNEANVMSYQLEVNALQEAGTYTNTLKYIATATF